MKFAQWKIAQQPEAAFGALRAQGVASLVAAVLCARGLNTRGEAEAFLSWHPKLLCDPFLLRDMSKATARIERALAAGETIAVYGDYDVDGITATCLLTHYLRARGGKVCYYIPCRLEEGYGVNREAIDALHQDGVTLLITVDCGITALDESVYASSLGMDMVITDHHECKETLPAAVAVVDPHRPDCSYPFKDLAGVGVALKLVLALAGADQTRQILEEYADLAAIGTVADVMRLLGENRSLVHLGLAQLQHTRRVGLAALMAEAGASGERINSTTIGYCLAPRINAAGRMGQAGMAAELILSEDPLQAATLSRALCDLNRERQSVELDIFKEATAQLDEQARHDSIVLARADWHQGVVGIVASRLAERYACPVFMISLQDGRGKGSCRSYGGFNLFRALEACSHLLEGFGGHALAAGFTIREENIPAFRAAIDALVQSDTGGEERVSTLEVDVDIQNAAALTLEEVDQLAQLEPYGNGNPKPVFALRGVLVTCVSEVGGGRHLKLRAARDGKSLDVIFFSTTRQQAAVQIGDLIDLAFYPQINTFRGMRAVQLHLVDLRQTQGTADAESDEALYARFSRGQALSPQSAGLLTPEREDFKTLWRYLTSCGGVTEESPERLLQHAAAFGQNPRSPVRLRVCLDVLAECGLVQFEQRDGRLRVRSRETRGEKKDLEQTKLMRRLRGMARQA